MTTTLTCAVCGAATQTYLCAKHLNEIREALRSLPTDLADLEAVATRQAKGPLGLGDPGRQWTPQSTSDTDARADLPARLRRTAGPIALPSTPWPYAPHASDMAWAVINTVSTWWRHICETRGLPADGDPRVGLLRNLDAIGLDEAAAQIHDELTSIRDAVDRAVIGRMVETKFLGRCDLPDIRVIVEDDALLPTLGYCGAEMYAKVNDKVFVCEVCGATYDVVQRRADLAERIADEWQRPYLIAAGLTELDQPVKVETLYKWISRKLVKQVGIDDEGHALYRVGDVQAMVQLQRERHARRASA